MDPVCAHCGHIVVLYGGAWVHNATGWRMCDLSASTFAEPYEEGTLT
jgi:hypothetical protein